MNSGDYRCKPLTSTMLRHQLWQIVNKKTSDTVTNFIIDKMNKSRQPDNEVFLAFQVIPRLKEGNNFEVVDKAIEVVKSAKVPYQVGAMETTMKGELDQLLDIVKAAQQACYDAGALEVITNIKIHSRLAEATDTFCTYHRGVTPANHMFVEK
jgi:uncharacterized protein YqgV (UPF0045/DUF77 family)